MVRFPEVSVIIPIHNEVNFISYCLNSIRSQDYPKDQIEIIIADGMSTDGTRELVQAYMEQQPQTHLIDNPGRIVPTGLNLALRQASGKIIVRVDGHTLIDPAYISQCVDALHRTKADNVGGRMNPRGENPFGNAVALATSTPFGIGGGRFHYSDQEEWVDTVYMGAWSRQVFTKIGMFDEELVRDQDDEFNYRLREAGGRILLSPKIRSTYTVRNDPYSLWRQYFQYGVWKVRVWQKHPHQMSLRQFVPPVFVFSLLFSVFLTFFIKTRLLSCIIPLLYLLANLSASIITAAKRSWKSLFTLPIVYSILHVAYGLGFLVGMVKFINRWYDRSGKVPGFSDEPTR
jgi:succinoglycan biosynthesis protein ExoA